MFIGVNELKGLVINLRNFDDSQITQWEPIARAISCTFLVRDDNQQQLLDRNVNAPYNWIICRYFPSRKIKEALAMIGIQPYEAAYVTASFRELDFILHEPLGSILINPSEFPPECIGKLPDFKLNNIADLKDVIKTPAEGYYSEVSTTNLARAKGHVLPLYNSGYLIVHQCPCDDKEFTLVSGGRYFGPEHPRHDMHQLSCRILKSKHNDNQIPLFYKVFRPIIRYVTDKIETVDGVTRIPPKPNKRDRFQSIVQQICVAGGFRNLSTSLTCIQDHPPQKSCVSKQARIENVSGKYQASANVAGLHVVLIDDIMTTGATTTECVRMLYGAGARRVTVVVLGINQFKPIWRTSPHPLLCTSEDCDGKMILRFYGNDMNVFWGCTNYRSTGCDVGMNFIDGVHAMNELNHWDYDEEDTEEEIEF